MKITSSSSYLLLSLGLGLICMRTEAGLKNVKLQWLQLHLKWQLRKTCALWVGKQRQIVDPEKHVSVTLPDMYTFSCLYTDQQPIPQA